MDYDYDYEMEIETIFRKIARGEVLDTKEYGMLAEWATRSPDHVEFLINLGDPIWMRERLREMNKIDTSRMWEKVKSGLAAQGVVLKHLSRWRKWLIHMECLWEKMGRKRKVG